MHMKELGKIYKTPLYDEIECDRYLKTNNWATQILKLDDEI